MFRRLVASSIFLILSALSGCVDVDGIARFVDDARTEAKIGVLGNLEVEWARDAKGLRTALEYFQSEQVDAVVLLGNLTKDGYLGQYRELATLWKKTMAPSVRLIAVRGFEEDAAMRPNCGTELKGIGVFEGPVGGDFEVEGFRFHASYAKCYKRTGLISFYSKGRMALTDEMCVSPRASRAVNVGSMSRLDVSKFYDDMPEKVIVAQGLLVRAYASEVEIDRLDFSTPARKAQPRGQAPQAEPVAVPWTYPRDAPAGSVKEQPGEAPNFASGVALQLVRGDDGNRRGLLVRFPPVLSRTGGVRAFSYEVSLDNPQKTVKNVLSYAFYLPESRETAGVTCTFDETDLAGAETVTVVPVSSTGVRGAPLTASLRGR